MNLFGGRGRGGWEGREGWGREGGREGGRGGRGGREGGRGGREGRGREGGDPPSLTNKVLELVSKLVVHSSIIIYTRTHERTHARTHTHTHIYIYIYRNIYIYTVYIICSVHKTAVNYSCYDTLISSLEMS